MNDRDIIVVHPNDPILKIMKKKKQILVVNPGDKPMMKATKESIDQDMKTTGKSLMTTSGIRIDPTTAHIEEVEDTIDPDVCWYCKSPDRPVYKTDGRSRPVCVNCAVNGTVNNKVSPRTVVSIQGRNEPCACGAGEWVTDFSQVIGGAYVTVFRAKKFKHCCINK